jgi:hypothetical protein
MNTTTHVREAATALAALACALEQALTDLGDRLALTPEAAGEAAAELFRLADGAGGPGRRARRRARPAGAGPAGLTRRGQRRPAGTQPPGGGAGASGRAEITIFGRICVA